MRLLIDVTNLIAGGGVSHIQELLNITSSEVLNNNNISKIFIVGVPITLNRIKDVDIIEKIYLDNLSSNFLQRFIWKLKNLNKIIKENNIDFVFNPGGSFVSLKIPYVTMCRNMLVFEKEEADRFGFTFYRFKFTLLKLFQVLSMKQAKGVIFLSQYAYSYIQEKHNLKLNKTTIVPHGVSTRFDFPVKEQLDISSYTIANPYKILYVSNLDVYKHHANVAKAIVELIHEKGFSLELTVVGAKAGGFKKFDIVSKRNPDIIKYLGKIAFDEIQNEYRDADMFIFASTCENMPNILIEAMTSGLPIACSQKLPMPEFLDDGGVYFNSENVKSIKSAIEKLLISVKTRKEIAEISKELASKYNWKRCSEETFKFISDCYNESL